MSILKNALLLNSKVMKVVYPVEEKWCTQIIELICITESCNKGDEYLVIPIIENFRVNWKNEIELTVKNNKWLNILTLGSVKRHLAYFYECEMNRLNDYMKSKNI